MENNDIEKRNAELNPSTIWPGTIWRHFKNKHYLVLNIAEHTETKEKLVIYRPLSGSCQVYARPINMFLSLVDKEKYPDAKQKYRFELINPLKFERGD